MTRYRNFVFLAATTLVGLSTLPVASADEWNKETEVTFSAPVEAPGVVLPAGSYIFKLANSDSDRTIVQIFRKDGDELVTTLLAIPASRITPTGETVITLLERPSGQPKAIHEWFYPGETDGVGFVYKDHVAEPAVSKAAAATSDKDNQDDAIQPSDEASDSSSAPDASSVQ
jgi:hypothetical protein